MTNDLLKLVRDRRAFDQSPASGALAAFHVPFDELITEFDGRYETLFLAAVSRGERVALIGASGSGKSSITEYVLGPPGPARIAPMRIRLGMQASDMETDPSAFPRLVVTTVAKQLSPVKKVRELDHAIRGGTSKRPKKFSVGGGFGWLTGNLALELGSVIAEPAQGEDVVDRAVDILQLIHRGGFIPTLVLDDTDQWIRRPGIDDPEPRIASFFGSTLRLIAERLPAACVIAVHNEYLTSPYYDQAKEFLDTRITLPALTDPDNLRAIITKRVRVAMNDSALVAGEIIDDSAVHRLFEHYAESKSVRRQMSVLHGAVVRACDAGAGVVGAEHVVSEIAAS